MSLVIFERFTKLALVRAAFWLVMGISLLIMPGFLLGGLFYVLIGYLLINAVFRINIFARETAAEHKPDNKAEFVCRYISLIIAILFVIAAISFIVYREWLNDVTPVFLGGFLMLEGVLYFVVALCAVKSLQKFLLVILSGTICLAAIISIVFTFGFGVGGLTGMTMVFGIALLLAFLYEMAAFSIARRNHIAHLG